MPNCKKFLDGIQSIKFTGDVGKRIQSAVLHSSYEELKRQFAEEKAIIEGLPKKTHWTETADEELNAYKKNLTATQSAIAEQLKTVERMAEEGDISLEKPDDFNDKDFVKGFATNFRNIRHLAEILSDAPPAIKKLQTHLYTEILFKLKQEEQEKQLQGLSDNNIQDMVNQSIEMYEATADEQQRIQCQKLVQMGIYELVRGDCAKTASLGKGDYHGYLDFIQSLTRKIPEVGESAILDNISQYKNTEGNSIGDLLKQVEIQLGMDRGDDWGKVEKIEVLKSRKTLLDKLRFGQEDRREYVKKTQENLARDLLWAREIKDIELFTKGGVADEVFKEMAEQRLGRPKREVAEQAKPKVKDYAGTRDKLLPILKIVVNEVTGGKFSKKIDLRDQEARDKYIPSIEKALKEGGFEGSGVTVAQGKITISFYELSEGSLASHIYRQLLLKEFSNTSASQVAVEVAKDEKIVFRSFSGYSWSEIEAQINKIKNPPIPSIKKAECKALVEKAIKTMPEDQIFSLKDLHLNADDELLLRKTIELNAVYLENQKIPFPPALTDAFKSIASGNYKFALKTKGLEEAATAGYLLLAKVDEKQLSAKVQPILQKAKDLNSSTALRKERQERLMKVFADPLATQEKINQVSAIFLEEYHEMLPTLGLSERDMLRLKHDITVMATEMVQLIERTNKGEPVINDQEQAAYFSALQQIAQALDGIDMKKVRFKMKHSATGLQPVNIFDETGNEIKIIEVDLGRAKLPYSLVKPLGGDAIFSFGGTRGMYAPFAGLDSAYAGEGSKKGRLFTHSRLLGVGQYGSIKEVESLLTGLNQVLKRGYPEVVKEGVKEPTFTDAARGDLRTRPISARNDPLYRIESDILQTLSEAEEEGIAGRSQYWLEKGKLRKEGSLFAREGEPQVYFILQDRAKGDSLADIANKELGRYGKGDLRYHNPCQRGKGEKKEGLGEKELKELGEKELKELEEKKLKELEEKHIKELGEKLALSEAIVSEAQRFQKLGFAHNDIKPENFLYKRGVDGNYEIKYIDWATGGFLRPYVGEKQDPQDIFAELFGQDLAVKNTAQGCSDPNGRFVKIDDEGKITYGINPSLQILHGARNGTLPYLSPEVLGENRDNQCLPADALPDPALNTNQVTNDPSLDDWALTSMLFGVCNRQAYFALVYGRAVLDYVVPGIIDIDGNGLKVINAQKFNDFFACEGDQASEKSLADGSFYKQQDGVMYIPSNKREGEPLHLYRRLQELRHLLQEKGKDAHGLEMKLVEVIDEITQTVRVSIAKGIGLSKDQLMEQLEKANHCFNEYEKLYGKEQEEKEVLKSDLLQKVLKNYSGDKKFSADSLQTLEGKESHLKILCLYPTPNTPQQKEATSILAKVINEDQLNDKFISPYGAAHNLLRDCITYGQEENFSLLVRKITKENPEFIKLVSSKGLLQYAAEQGFTTGFADLVNALSAAGLRKDEIFNLAMEKGQKLNYIKWEATCFDTAIRNNNESQLTTLLTLLPEGEQSRKSIDKALYLSASSGNRLFFDEILTKWNDSHPQDLLTAEKIATEIAFPPDYLSPYHLLLRDETNSDLFAKLEKNIPLVKAFLGVSSSKIPSVVPLAAESGNFLVLDKFIQWGETEELSLEEWEQFFTQKNEEGKNQLNHILEQRRFERLTTFIGQIEKNCGPDKNKVLVNLLSNSHPVNPLSNFLDSEKDSLEKKLAVTSQLLNVICPHLTAKEYNQKDRVVILLRNKDWLVKQANEEGNHLSLQDFLQNEALSSTYKQILFKELKGASSTSLIAQQFYSDLLAQVSPSADEELNTIAKAKITDIRVEVAKKTNDLNALIAALTSDREVVQELTKKVEIAEERLETTVRQFDQKQDELEEQLLRVRHETKGDIIIQEQEITRLTSKMNANRREMEKVKQDYVEVTEKRDAAIREELKKAEAQDKKNIEEQLTSLTKKREQLEEKIVEKIDTEKTRAEEAKTKIEDIQLRLDQEELKTQKLNQQLSDVEREHAAKVTSIQDLSRSPEEAANEIKVALAKEREEFEDKKIALQESLDYSAHTMSKLNEQKVSCEELQRTSEQTINDLEDQLSNLVSPEEHEKLLVALGEQVEKKASINLRLTIKSSNDQELLRNVIAANNKDELIKAGLHKKDVKVMAVEALGDITEAANERLEELKLIEQKELLQDEVNRTKEELVNTEQRYGADRKDIEAKLREQEDLVMSGAASKSELEGVIASLKQELISLKEENTEKLNQLNETHAKALSEQKELLQDEVRRTQEALTTTEQRYEADRQDIEAKLREQEDLVMSGAASKSELEGVIANLKQELISLKEENTEKLNQLNETHAKALSEQKELLQDEVNRTREALTTTEHKYETERKDIEAKLREQEELVMSGAASKSELEGVIASLKQELTSLKEENTERLTQLNETYAKTLSEQKELFEAQVNRAKEGLQEAERQHDEELQAAETLRQKQKQFLGFVKEDNEKLAAETAELHQELTFLRETQIRLLKDEQVNAINAQKKLLESNVTNTNEALENAQRNNEEKRQDLETQLQEQQQLLENPEVEDKTQVNLEIDRIQNELNTHKEESSQRMDELKQEYDEARDDLKNLLEAEVSRTKEELSKATSNFGLDPEAEIKLREKEERLSLGGVEEESKLVADINILQEQLTENFRIIEQLKENHTNALKEEKTLFETELSRKGEERASVERVYAEERQALKMKLQEQEQLLAHGSEGKDELTNEVARLTEQLNNLNQSRRIEIENLKDEQAKLQEELEGVLRTRASEQEQLRVEEQQRPLSEKDPRIQDLEQKMAKLAQKQAMTSLKTQVDGSDDLELLRAVASANNNKALSQEKKLKGHYVERLQDENAYKKLVGVAKKRLEFLEEKALAALQQEVASRKDVGLLKDVAAAKSNSDLLNTDLNEDCIDALQEEKAYEVLVKIAAQRLEAQNKTMEALRNNITKRKANKKFLTEIADATNNTILGVRAGVDPVPLIDVDAYKDFTQLAGRYLDDLDNSLDSSQSEDDSYAEEPLFYRPELSGQSKALTALQKQIARSKDEELLEKVRDAKNSEALEEAGLDAKDVEALMDNESAVQVVAAAAEARLKDLIALRVIRQGRFLDPYDYEKVLADERSGLKGIYKNLNNINSVDRKVRNELRSLGGSVLPHWLNPGFQSSAKQNAKEMEAHFKRLAKGCNTIVNYLKPLRHELKDQLASLPAPTELVGIEESQRKAIQERREVLDKYLRFVEKELDLHNPLQKQLNGDRDSAHPLLKQGVLKTIQQAKEEQHDLEFLAFTSYYEDHPIKDKEKYFGKAYNPATVKPRPVVLENTDEVPVSYRTVQRVKEGYFREHIINPGKYPNQITSGSFIEVRPSSYSKEDRKEHRPKIALTINEFPELVDEDEIDGAVLEQLEVERVTFAFAMASQLLAGFGKTPTAEKPLPLYGSNPEQLRYLWTALMVIGRETPHMKFDHKAIKLVSTAFSPHKEIRELSSWKSFFGGPSYEFTANSCYEKSFKDHPVLDNLLLGIKEASEHKFGQQKAREETKKTVTKAASKFFQPDTRQTIEELELENKKSSENNKTY